MTALAMALVEPSALPAGEADELQGIVDGLTEAGRSIEGTFLRAGSGLIGCVKLLGEMLAAFEELGHRLGGDELQSALTTLSGLGGHADAFVTRFVEGRSATGDLHASLASARPRIDDLHRAVAMISAVSINARVVAAGMHQSGDGLEVFTDDVSQLAGSAVDTVKELSERHLDLLGAVRSVGEKSSGFETEFRASLASLSDSLSSQVGGVGSRCAMGAEACLAAGEMSRRFKSRVSEAVMSLQVGDNVRQRIEHVVAGIAIARSLLAGAPAGELGAHMPSAPEDQEYVAQAVLCLQAAQLSAALAGMDSEVSHAADIVLELSHEMKDALGQRVEAFRAIRATDGTSLATLAGVVADLADRLREIEDESREIEGLAAQVNETTSKLLQSASAMRVVEFEMQLLSVNTAIKCSKVGEKGRALAVISQQLRELTGEMVDRSEAASAALAEVETVARRCMQEADDAASADAAGLEASARGSLRALENIDGSLADAVRILTDREKDLEGLTCRAREAFAGQGAVLATVAGIRQQLDRVIAARGPIPSRGRDVSDGIRHLLEHLRKSYTMEEERQIHARFAGTDEPAPPHLQAGAGDPAVADAQDGDEDGDENEDVDAFLF